MNLVADTHYLLMLFVLPGIFSFTLVGEGVGKVMNYDPHGWVSVTIGGSFLIVIFLAYFIISTNFFG